MEIYDREKAKQYAKIWAYNRNPNYYNYDALGGDCTNFISQCIYAGAGIMNYKKTFGWYYNTANDKSPSWTGAEFLYNFLINNKGKGPVGENSNMAEVQIGDIVQLSFNGTNFTHSLLIVKKDNGNIYTASHTFDAYERNLNSYLYKKIRFIHIKGINKNIN